MGELERDNKENFKNSNYQNKNDLTSEKSIREWKRTIKTKEQ